MDTEGSFLHKSPPLVPILSQMNRVHTTPSYFYKMHLNIILPPTSWSSQWYTSFWLSHQVLGFSPKHATCLQIWARQMQQTCHARHNPGRFTRGVLRKSHFSSSWNILRCSVTQCRERARVCVCDSNVLSCKCKQQHRKAIMGVTGSHEDAAAGAGLHRILQDTGWPSHKTQELVSQW
jgi:hypothetical protein